MNGVRLIGKRFFSDTQVVIESSMTEHLEPEYFLGWASEISRTHPFMDFHVHPFDVFSGDIGYQADVNIKGLFFKGTAIYNPPTFESNEESLSGRFQTG